MKAFGALVMLLSLVAAPLAAAFSPTSKPSVCTARKAAESEVSFGDLDGSNVRIGIIRTRWNDEHVSNLVSACRKALKDCNVKDEYIFETEVPGCFELPIAARFLALSQTVDAIVTAGVLIKGDTMHFEYISEATASGLMSVGLQTSTPVVYGVLNCLDEEQVKSRSSGDNNHGYGWGKTAVEMALLRTEALDMKGGGDEAAAKLEKLGFGKKAEEKKEKKSSTYF